VHVVYSDKENKSAKIHKINGKSGVVEKSVSRAIRGDNKAILSFNYFCKKG
jgi:uncharacterized protein (DUF2344 family)